MPPWTKRDTAALRVLVSEGWLTLKQMKYGRTVHAIQAQLFCMGILKELPFFSQRDGKAE